MTNGSMGKEFLKNWSVKRARQTKENNNKRREMLISWRLTNLSSPCFKVLVKADRANRRLGVHSPDKKQLKHRTIKKVSVCDNRPGLSVVSQEPQIQWIFHMFIIHFFWALMARLLRLSMTWLYLLIFFSTHRVSC